MTIKDLTEALESMQSAKKEFAPFFTEQRVSIYLKYLSLEPVHIVKATLVSRLSPIFDQLNDTKKQNNSFSDNVKPTTKENTYRLSAHNQNKPVAQQMKPEADNVKSTAKQSAFVVPPKKEQPTVKQPDLASGKSDSIKASASTAQKTTSVPHPIHNATPQQIKNWRANREQKGFDNPFTKVQVQTLDKKTLFTAELLNSLPASTLKANGWTAKEIATQKSNHHAIHPLSKQALNSLGDSSSVYSYRSPERLVFGEGGWGKIKHARITLPGSSQPHLCVAKKISVDYSEYVENAFEEMKLQNQSGVGVKVHGIADTKTKKGQRQCILFMEKAKGVDGFDFLYDHSYKLSEKNKLKLTNNLLQQVLKMHGNSVYHSDLKWENVFVDPQTLDVQILDFGLATNKKHAYHVRGHETGCGYNAPELLFGNKNKHGYVDREKSDVFTLGVMLGKLFSHPEFMSHTIKHNRQHMLPEIIKRQVYRLRINDQALLDLVTRMVSLNPESRPNIKEVISALSSLGQHSKQSSHHYWTKDSYQQDSRTKHNSDNSTGLFNQKSHYQRHYDNNNQYSYYQTNYRSAYNRYGF